MTGTREYLTVRELADLLRIGERKVYDLAASGEVPVTRVTGKLLFPEKEVRAWIAGLSGRSGAQRPAVLLGSHDPLLDWAVRQSRSGLALRSDGSLDGLVRFRAGEGVATGLHLRDPGGETWNLARVAEVADGMDAVLIAWSRRTRGLCWRPGGGAAIRGISDLVGRRVVPRAAETGTQELFERMVAREGLSMTDFDLAPTAPTENDAVMAVAQGQADAAFGLEAVASLFGLSFVPLVEERFDLLVDRRAWFDPPMQRLFSFCRGTTFRDHADAVTGVDVSDLGEVRWNG